MAYNFFIGLSTNKNFPTAMQRRFEVILARMNMDYALQRGEVAEIATELARAGIARASTEIIRTDVTIIKNVVRLLREGPDARAELEKKSQRTTQAALTLFDRLPEDMTWERVVKEMDTSGGADGMFSLETDEMTADTASKDREKTAAASMHPALGTINQVLIEKDQQLEKARVRIEELEEQLAVVRSAYSRLDEQRYNVLKGFAFSSENATSELSADKTELENDRKTAYAVYGLPRYASRFGNTEITYRPSFWRRFNRLHPEIKGRCARAISELAAKGWKETESSQQHKPTPAARSDVAVPKGAWVSRISSKWRYVWMSKGNGTPAKHITILYIGPHDMWDSQK